MTCKLKHEDPDVIPVFLCVVCTPRVTSGDTPALDISRHLAADDRLARLEQELEGKRIALAATSGRAPKARAKLEADIAKLSGKIAALL